MPDPALHGNGDDCPACALRREERRAAGAMAATVPCNFCGGNGRVGRAVAAIIAEACAWAVAHYWPAKEAEWRAENERMRNG